VVTIARKAFTRAKATERTVAKPPTKKHLVKAKLPKRAAVKKIVQKNARRTKPPATPPVETVTGGLIEERVRVTEFEETEVRVSNVGPERSAQDQDSTASVGPEQSVQYQDSIASVGPETAERRPGLESEEY
jgi:hypothetical protein